MTWLLYCSPLRQLSPYETVSSKDTADRILGNSARPLFEKENHLLIWIEEIILYSYIFWDGKHGEVWSNLREKYAFSVTNRLKTSVKSNILEIFVGSEYYLRHTSTCTRNIHVCTYEFWSRINRPMKLCLALHSIQLPTLSSHIVLLSNYILCMHILHINDLRAASMTGILQYIWAKFILICGTDKKLMANKDTYQYANVVISKYALNVDRGWDIDLGNKYLLSTLNRSTFHHVYEQRWNFCQSTVLK